METASLPTACPDCGGPLRPIQLMIGQVRQLGYWEEGAKKNFWTSTWTAAGTVQTLACSDCRRVFQYAVPKA